MGALDFGFHCEGGSIHEGAAQVKCDLTEDIRLLEIDGFQVDQARAEVPDGPQLEQIRRLGRDPCNPTHGGNDPVVLHCSPDQLTII